jgi:hypothetical protein
MLSVIENDPKQGLTVGSGGSNMSLTGVAPTTGSYSDYQRTSTTPGYAATWGPAGSVQGVNTGAYSDGGSGSGSTAPAYDPGDMAYLEDQLARLNSQYGRTDTTLRTGLEKILQDYNSQKAGANTKQSRFLSDVGTARQDSERGKDTAIGKVDTNARILANSLRQRLGMAGGADSSAYKITAPGAVAREATQDRTGVMENFGVNFRDLKTREDRGIEDFGKLISDLARQKESSSTDFRAGIDEQRNSIDSNRAEIARQKALLQGGGYDQVRSAMSPYTQQISARESAIDKMLGNVRKINPGSVDVSIPNLRDYMVDKSAINANRQSGTQNPYAPYKQSFEEEENVNTLV